MTANGPSRHFGAMRNTPRLVFPQFITYATSRPAVSSELAFGARRFSNKAMVTPSRPQAPRQHRISWVRRVANSYSGLLVFNVHREQRRRAREAPDQCRDL
jgi:hypothetical protein